MYNLQIFSFMKLITVILRNKNHSYIQDSKYKTYPRDELYKNGLPIYNSEYNLLDSHDIINNNIEHFNSNENKKCSCKISIIICIILVLIAAALVKTRKLN